MRIAPFSELTTRERERFFQAVSAGGLPPAFASAAEMEPYLLGPAFEAGSTYLTLWDGETLAGAIGVVVREVAVKGEVFLTLLYVLAAETEAVLGRLLRAAYAVVGATPEVVVKIGVGAKQSHLHEPLERAGCRMAYRVLNMVRPVDGALPAASAAVRFEPLSAANAADYLIVHNAAFLHSPNGSQMTPAQVDALRLEVRCPDFVQVGYAGSEPAALLRWMCGAKPARFTPWVWRPGSRAGGWAGRLWPGPWRHWPRPAPAQRSCRWWTPTCRRWRCTSAAAL